MYDIAKRRQNEILKKEHTSNAKCVFIDISFKSTLLNLKNPLKFMAIYFVAVGKLTARMHLNMYFIVVVVVAVAVFILNKKKNSFYARI